MRFRCPWCGRGVLKQIPSPVKDCFKCYTSCYSIFRLSSDIPPKLIKLDSDGREGESFQCEELSNDDSSD